MRVDIFITHLSGERLWNYDRPLPPKADLSINVSLMEVARTAGGVEVPFMMTINYHPPIAHISMKGRALIVGTEEEVKSILEQEGRSPPPQLMQAISTVCIAEAAIISRSLNIPPPIPPIGLPQQEDVERKRPTTTYMR